MDTARNNKLAIWAITPNGIDLGARLADRLRPAVLFLPEKEALRSALKGSFSIEKFSALGSHVERMFHQYGSHVFIFSTGIAVRLISRMLVSKATDPAVVVLDEKGIHAVSLVSGHLGGANALACRISEQIGANPVITTATDLNHLPSIDMLAKQADLFIETVHNIKHVNMRFLKDEPVRIYDPLGIITSRLPEERIEISDRPETAHLVCTHETLKVPRETLVLRPENLVVGMGCNRQTKVTELYDLLSQVFKERGFSRNSIWRLASSRVKSDEPGLLKLAEKMNLTISFYENHELNAVETVENPSKMAEKHLGVRSVCEASAILGANQGTLIVPKQKTQNATLAVAIKQ